MIRLVIKHRMKRGSLYTEELSTIDIEIPELECALTVGGFNYSTDEYETYDLVGVEVLKKE